MNLLWHKGSNKLCFPQSSILRTRKSITRLLGHILEQEKFKYTSQSARVPVPPEIKTEKWGFQFPSPPVINSLGFFSFQQVKIAASRAPGERVRATGRRPAAADRSMERIGAGRLILQQADSHIRLVAGCAFYCQILQLASQTANGVRRNTH